MPSADRPFHPYIGAVILEARKSFQLNNDLLECLNLPDSGPPESDSNPPKANASKCRSALKSIATSIHVQVLLLVLACSDIHLSLNSVVG